MRSVSIWSIIDFPEIYASYEIVITIRFYYLKCMLLKASVFLVLAVTLIFAFGGCHREQPRGHRSARIGVLVPLTGPAAEIGKSLQNGLLLGQLQKTVRTLFVTLMSVSGMLRP